MFDAVDGTLAAALAGAAARSNPVPPSHLAAPRPLAHYSATRQPCCGASARDRHSRIASTRVAMGGTSVQVQRPAAAARGRVRDRGRDVVRRDRHHRRGSPGLGPSPLSLVVQRERGPSRPGTRLDGRWLARCAGLPDRRERPLHQDVDRNRGSARPAEGPKQRMTLRGGTPRELPGVGATPGRPGASQRPRQIAGATSIRELHTRGTQPWPTRTGRPRFRGAGRRGGPSGARSLGSADAITSTTGTARTFVVSEAAILVGFASYVWSPLRLAEWVLSCLAALGLALFLGEDVLSLDDAWIFIVIPVFVGLERYRTKRLAARATAYLESHGALPPG